jgi:hypothetical protein
MPQPQQKVQHILMTVIVTVTRRRRMKIGDRSHDLNLASKDIQFIHLFKNWYHVRENMSYAGIWTHKMTSSNCR